MKIIITMFFATICILVPVSTMAGAPCPVNSCNPNNGCMLGCYPQRISGVSNCTPQNPLLAQESAKKAAWLVGYGKCYEFFLLTKWAIKQYAVGQQCFVSAEADVACPH